MMENFDWYDIKFLESVSNIKYVIEDTLGKKPNTEVASGIAICLQQGRMFFESAKNAPFEIRPLLTLYGIIGFSKGLVLARSIKKIETLRSSHGLKDISLEKSKLYESCLKIRQNGNFQAFNDVVSHMGSVSLLDKYNENYALGKHYDKSLNITGITVSFKEILSRIINIRNYYKDTFKEKCKAIKFKLVYEKESELTYYLSNKPKLTKLKLIDDSGHLSTDFDSLKEYIEELKDCYPFLKNWFLYEVTQYPEHSIYEYDFYNIDKSTLDEFSGQFIDLNYMTDYTIISKKNIHSSFDKDEIFGKFEDLNYDVDYYIKSFWEKPNKRKFEKVIEINTIRNKKEKIRILELRDILPPIINEGSNFDLKFSSIQPINGYYISQYSLQYMGMYLLSSLVRYRPHIWVNAISAADGTLALIELFVNMVLNEFPKMIVNEIKRKTI